ncbi:AmmeMemoRadiSam system protein B [Desulfogranum japonicum]|uniref:AmmeMemoRadiSam system protein B n=1 Tax=Desulfogranum japonicum TaxID=231447 RepID=UPI000427FDAA|nr:AmmeMemoRadiSam system protein B [Desulfogranum japonicum]
MQRQPVAAGRFYPGTQTGINDTLNLFQQSVPSVTPHKAVAVIVPHAGYIYSGATAFKTLGQVTIPDTVVLIGPNHHGQGARVAVAAKDWQMPWGTVTLNTPLVEALPQTSPLFELNDLAHEFEHSLEVQLPLLHHFRPDVEIVPIAVFPLSFAECEQAANTLADVITQQQEQVLLLASTDMTHYKSRADATKSDIQAIEQMLAFNPKGLYDVVKKKNISMCGMVPTVIIMLTARQLGADSVELVEYTDSGEASGDTSQVVGYAGLVVS